MLYDVARRHYILTFKAIPLIYNFHMVSHNFLQNSIFIGSYPSYEDLPDDSGSEIAFCGRSNCGKSSVLNAILIIRNWPKQAKRLAERSLLMFLRLIRIKTIKSLICQVTGTQKYQRL